MVNKVIVTKGTTTVLTAATTPNVTIAAQPSLSVTTTGIGPRGAQGLIGLTPSGSIVATNITLTGNPVSGGSGVIISGSAGSSAFIIAMPGVPGDDVKLKVNGEGVTVFGQPASEPTPVSGGIYYLNGVFYLGDNS